jgi:RNA polymerase sigma-70 factor, ECF subfamily
MHSVTPMLPSSDDERVRRAATGEIGAFQELYRAHLGRVHALCRRMCGDPVAAEEMTQAVFIRAWERLGSFRGESAFGTWLHRLAVNVVLGDRRAEGRRLARVLPLHDPTEGHAGVPPRERDVAIDLQRALDELPPKARQVFVLFEIEGWPHEDIAKHMNTTVGTSKGQLHRARELMRRALA